MYYKIRKEVDKDRISNIDDVDVDHRVKVAFIPFHFMRFGLQFQIFLVNSSNWPFAKPNSVPLISFKSRVKTLRGKVIKVTEIWKVKEGYSLRLQLTT